MDQYQAKFRRHYRDEKLITEYGFNYVWLTQHMVHTQLFLSEFTMRIKDTAVQQWHMEVTSNNRLNSYMNYKTDLIEEKYVYAITEKCFKRALSRLRCSSHCLQIELGRRNNTNREDRNCIMCLQTGVYLLEDEFHFMLKCEELNNIRKKCLPFVCNANPTYETFYHLLANKSTYVINQVGKYVYFAMKYRKQVLDCIAIE